MSEVLAFVKLQGQRGEARLASLFPPPLSTTHHPGVAGKFFTALGKARINIRASAQGSSERNISAVIVAPIRSERDTLYLAGRIGIDPQTGRPPEDVEKEILLLLDG